MNKTTTTWKGGTHDLQCVGINTGWVWRTNPFCAQCSMSQIASFLPERGWMWFCIYYTLVFVIYNTFNHKKFTWSKKNRELSNDKGTILFWKLFLHFIMLQLNTSYNIFFRCLAIYQFIIYGMEHWFYSLNAKKANWKCNIN